MDSEVRAKNMYWKVTLENLAAHPHKKFLGVPPSSWAVNSELRINALSLMLISVNYTILHLYSLPCMKND